MSVDDWFRAFATRLARVNTKAPLRPPSLLLFRISSSSSSSTPDLLYSIDAREPEKNVTVGKVSPSLRASIEATTSISLLFNICTLTYSSEQVFLGLVNSTRSPQYAYLAGDAKISGNSDVLKALGPLLKKTKTAMGDDHHQQDMHGSSFHVEFLPAEDAVVSSGNVVRYPVQCNLDGKRWTIYKRYSEFVKLDREVKEEERRRCETSRRKRNCRKI